MSWFPSFLKSQPEQRSPQPGATPRNSRRPPAPSARTTGARVTTRSSIVDSPVSVVHRLADEAEEEFQLDVAHALEATPANIPAASASPSQAASPPESSEPRIVARINHGVVEFRVSNLAAAVTYERLQAACAEQLPHVGLEYTTKWFQYTFDLWSHGDSCLYVIPIASLSAVTPLSAQVSAVAPEGAVPVASTAPVQKQPGSKPRRRGSDLAAHHPRG